MRTFRLHITLEELAYTDPKELEENPDALLLRRVGDVYCRSTQLTLDGVDSLERAARYHVERSVAYLVRRMEVDGKTGRCHAQDERVVEGPARPEAETHGPPSSPDA